MDFNWLWVVPILGILIVVHEMGHFFSAIWLGIKVQEFGIGFPPRMFAVRYKGIDYSMNWLPIGGFVKIEGENGDSDDPRSFGRAPAWKRVIVLAAGSFMNLLLAVLIFAGMSVSGTPEINAPDTGILHVIKGRPAADAGIMPGDRIMSIGGTPVSSSGDIRRLSREHLGSPTAYVILRDGKEISLTVTPQGDPPLGVSIVHWISPVEVASVQPGSPAAKAGLKPGDRLVSVAGEPAGNLAKALYLFDKAPGTKEVTVERKSEIIGPLTLSSTEGDSGGLFGMSLVRPIRMVYYSPLEALGKSLDNTWNVISSIPSGVAQTVEGKAQGPGLTGIVGISQLTGEVAQESGTNGLLTLTALLGISLFMINLLPLPALDGGRLLFIFVELLRGGRRISPEKEGLVHFAGMVLLLALMAIITFFDVGRILGGESILPGR